MGDRHVAIVGAGPGGLTAGMILARRGFRVTVFEKKPVVGGRNAPLRLDGYTFDTGPTFLMLLFILRDVFAEAGARLEDHMELTRLDPMYRLRFQEFDLEMTGDHERMAAKIDAIMPGMGRGVHDFVAGERRRFEVMFPCLQMPYESVLKLVHPNLLKALPHLGLGRSVIQNLGRYFDSLDLQIAFTFQAKYLGMSPWSCPAAFSILPYIEHEYGVYHVTGGLNRISAAMARLVEANGGAVRLETPVDRLVLSGGRATGVRLASGEVVEADAVLLDSDFGHSVCSLFPEGSLRRWSPAGLERKKLSCSTFMLYLGVKGRYDTPHHNIAFAGDYRRNIDDIFTRGVLSEEFSFYVQNASVTDSTLAPEGCSTLYVLVPVPNTRAEIDWGREASGMRERVISAMESRMGLPDLRKRIEVEQMITPQDWEADYSVYRGATFNLAHTIDQMLYFRPGNRFAEVDGVYLAGGGTHPGSGLPTIYESGRISANLISKRFGVPFTPPTSLAGKDLG